MNKTFANFREVIAAWPSMADFAADIGVKENTAKLMRFRDSIAAEHWHVVVAKARQRGIKGVTTDLLAQLLAEKKVSAAA